MPGQSQFALDSTEPDGKAGIAAAIGTDAFYRLLYESFASYFLLKAPAGTRLITATIKQFFHEMFVGNYTVLRSAPQGKANEYMVDVLVTTFEPQAALSDDRRFECSASQYIALLAVESEIGGASAGTGKNVMRNVVQDYLKLLLMRSKYRVLIFTSLDYQGEGDHVAKRAEKLREIYTRATGICGGVLLIHLNGIGGGQVSVAVRERGDIRGFIVSSDGMAVQEIPQRS